jgi:tetratricopeptide (TPR) repeat protein
LAYVLSLSGNTQGAIRHYNRALELRPDLLVANHNLASILATHPEANVRDGARAVRLAERACSITDYQSPECLTTLAAAYAEAARFSDAVRTAEQAAKVARHIGRIHLAESVQEQLASYQAAKPFRAGASSNARHDWSGLAPGTDLSEAKNERK